MFRRVNSKGMASDRRGSVALEVALLFPLAVIVLVGFAETYFYMRAVVISERVVAGVADMLAKRNSLADCSDVAGSANLGTHVMAAEMMMAPLDLKANGMLIMSGISDQGRGPTIGWQRRTTYTVSGISSILGQQGGVPVLPAGIVIKPATPTITDTLVVAELVYRFKPFSGIRTFIPTLPLEITIRRTAYARSRWGSISVLQVNGCTAAALPTP